MDRRRLSTLLLIFAMSAAAQAPDWTKVRAEALEHFTALLKIDTSNPPGNETKAAEYVKAALARKESRRNPWGPTRTA